MKVDLLRHGELVGGVKYRGRQDDPLTEAGAQSMQCVWQQVHTTVQVIYASPLSRCRELALKWAAQQGIPCHIDERIAEMHYGEWEGLTHDEIHARDPGMLVQWRNNPEGMRPPGGESPEELQLRIGDFWNGLTEQHQGEHVLVVAHSGSLRMLIAAAMNAPIVTTRHLHMPYACWSRLETRHGQSLLAFHNRQPEAQPKA